MQNFRNQPIKSYNKTTVETFSDNQRTVSVSETYTEFETYKPIVYQESKSNLKSINSALAKMLKFILSLEGLMSFSAYFKCFQFINPSIILMIDSLINITTSLL